MNAPAPARSRPMRLEILGLNVPLSPSLAEYAQHRLTTALDCFEHRIARATLRMSDGNGHRGGIDQRCHITVAVRGGGEVVVQDVAHDPYVAIDQAVTRLKHVVSRAIGRARKARRRSNTQVAINGGLS